MSGAFTYELPWSYPGHRGWGRYAVGWYDGRPRGLVHIGVTDPGCAYGALGGEPSTPLLRLIQAAPPRMCFAFAPTADDAYADDFCETFATAVGIAATGDRPEARKLLKKPEQRAPMATKICRGLIDLGWSRSRAEDSFGDAVEIGERCLRAGFTGVLPWSQTTNRPFLAALRCLAWSRWRAGDAGSARRMLDSLLWLEPTDAQDVSPWIALLDERVSAEDPRFPELAVDWWELGPPRDRWGEPLDTFPDEWA